MIIYAPSYAGLVQGLKIKRYDEIEIISNNRKIIQFCDQNKIMNQFIDLHKANNKNEILVKKKYAKKKSKSIIGKEILFCFYGFDILGLYFMYQLKKNNIVYFYNRDNEFKTIPIIKLFTSIGILKEYALYLSQLKLNLAYFKISEDRGFFGIPPNRLKKDFKTPKHELCKENFSINQQYFSNKISLPENAIIFIDQGNDAFKIEEETINQIKASYDKENFFVKPHPNFGLSNKLWITCNQIPREIPLELIINEKMTLIGICSTSLIGAETNKKISIINKVKWKSEKALLKYRKIVQEARNIEII